MRCVIVAVVMTTVISIAAPAIAQTSPPTFGPEQELLPAPGAYLGAIEIHGTIALVGSPRDTSPANRPGIVHVYRRTGGDDCQVTPCWTFQGPLSRPGSFVGDRFGTSIEYDGRTLVIGSPGDPSGANGAVVIYERDGNTFALRQTIVVPSGEPNFAVRVSLDGTRMAVSAAVAFSDQNAVYVFVRGPKGVWTQEAHLVPPQESEDQFGVAVDLDGNELIVGADDSTGKYADIFRRTGAQWRQQARIRSPQQPPGSFGRAVEIAGNRAFVGDPLGNSVHEFLRAGGTWMPINTLTSADGAMFGGAVQLKGRHNLFVGSGDAVHLYEDSSGGWNEQARFMAPGTMETQNEETLDAQGKRLGAIFGFSARAFVFDTSSTSPPN